MGLVSREQRINEHLARLQLHIERSHCAETRRHNRAFLRGVRVALWCLSMRLTPAQIDQELRAELFGTPPPSVGRATPGPRPRAEVAE